MVVLTSKEISALIAYKGMSLKEAAYDVIMNQVAALGGGGGAIAIDKNGNVATPFLGEGMFRGYMRSDEKMVVKIFDD
jgi:beta-aspartyl-peptidase (threonine type)